MNAFTYSPHSVLWLLGVLFTVLIVCTLVRRFRAGATIRTLRRSRFHEIFPLRLLIHGVHLALWWMALRLVLHFLHLMLTALGDDTNVWSKALFLTALAALLASASGLLCFRFWIRPGCHELPEVMLPANAIRRGIDSGAFAEVGRESFPSPLTASRREEWLRRLLVLVACVIWGASAAIKLDAGDSPMTWIADAVMALVSAAAWLVGFLGAPFSQACMLVTMVALAVLMWWNRSYGLLRFIPTLAVAGSLAFTATLMCEAGGHDRATALKWSIGFATMIAIRMIRDLLAARAYLRMRSVADPITNSIRATGIDLAALEHRDDCMLSDIDENSTKRRIAMGCRNAEQSDPLVQRNFTRFLKLTGVEIQHTSIAARRFLTVGRHTTETCAGGTPAWLSNPLVPMWNEEMFPLRVPEGFVNHLDTLLLGSVWDRVSQCGGCAGSGRTSCGTCGGSGSVHVNNSRKTCSNCGGSGTQTCGCCSGFGRQLFRRHLNTSWKRLMPTLSSPACDMPELLEDAQERTYFREVMVEDRKEVRDFCFQDGLKPDLVLHLEAVADNLRAAHCTHANEVVALHGARYLYRSDFIVAGFWTIRIRCGWLRGGCGWFFGKRPEFHFPILPLSIGNWASIATGVPLLAGLGLRWHDLISRFLASVS